MPATIKWFRIYCVVLAALYVLVAALGVAILALPPEKLQMGKQESVAAGGLFIVMGLVFFLLVLPGLFLPPRPGGWIYGLVLICIGLTSVLFLPICIPLLIFWLKPPVQFWFGRNLS
ncbi:MAG: hypothetical protein AAGA96_03760 [Verrucomicrobiota bacterium]